MIARRRRRSRGQRISGAESSRKVLSLLLLFRHDRPTATVEQLATEVGVPLSTAYRYVMLLRNVGLLEAGDAGIQVSPRVIELAKAAVAANSIIQVAHPVLQSMCSESGESARLTRRLNDRAVCIDQVDTGQPVRLTFELGQPKPLYSGASAKVLLAFMPERDLQKYLAGLPSKFPDGRSRKALLEEVPVIRQRGWALSEGEVDAGVWSAAAAISNGRQVVATASISAPAYRLAKAQRSKILSIVRKGAAQISARISPLHE